MTAVDAVRRWLSDHRLGGVILLLLLVWVGLPTILGVAGFDVLVPTAGSMEPAFGPGDVVLYTETSWTDIEEGDVVVFRTEALPVPVAHRVVSKNATRLTTRGDDAGERLAIERGIRPEQIEGEVVLTVPVAGYVLRPDLLVSSPRSLG